MALVEWGEAYSVGVEAMDKDHRKLVQMLNDLYDAMLSGRAQEETDTLLRALVDYTQSHFVAEEKLMARIQYPNYPEHRARHLQLVSQVQARMEQQQKGNPFLPIPLLHFVSDWLTTHIQQEDKAYGEWMHNRGLH